MCAAALVLSAAGLAGLGARRSASALLAHLGIDQRAVDEHDGLLHIHDNHLER